MPKQYRVAILGPSKSGKHTIANKLSAKYGWKLIDLEQLIRDAIEAEKLTKDNPRPNNPKYDQIFFA